MRELPKITGDGRSNIKALIEIFRNSLSENNPYWDDFREPAQVERLLAAASVSLDDILPEGEAVLLSQTAEGSIHHDVTEIAERSVIEAIERAAQAIGLVNCGLDLIVDEAGEVFILEVNQRSYIGMHSFPSAGASRGQGNAVAEAIVDYYFPETVDHKSHAKLAYDFASVLSVLDTGQVSEVSLPVIGPDWRVLRFAETGPLAKMQEKAWTLVAHVAGVFVRTMSPQKQHVEICLAGAPQNFGLMRHALPGPLRQRFETVMREEG